MPRSPYKGTKVWNKVLCRYMHKVADYTSNRGCAFGVYSDMTPVLVQILQKRIRDHYQNVIGIDGEAGGGKSTLGIQIAKAMDPSWDLELNYVYTKGQLHSKLSNWRTRSPITLIDEGTNVINALDFRSKEDNSFVVVLDTMRSFGWTTIICSPNFWAINKRVRNDHTNYLLAIPRQPLLKGYDKRGFYEVY